MKLILKLILALRGVWNQSSTKIPETPTIPWDIVPFSFVTRWYVKDDDLFVVLKVPKPELITLGRSPEGESYGGSV